MTRDEIFKYVKDIKKVTDGIVTKSTCTICRDSAKVVLNFRRDCDRLYLAIFPEEYNLLPSKFEEKVIFGVHEKAYDKYVFVLHEASHIEDAPVIDFDDNMTSYRCLTLLGLYTEERNVLYNINQEIEKLWKMKRYLEIDTTSLLIKKIGEY